MATKIFSTCGREFYLSQGTIDLLGPCPRSGWFSWEKTKTGFPKYYAQGITTEKEAIKAIEKQTGVTIQMTRKCNE